MNWSELYNESRTLVQRLNDWRLRERQWTSNITALLKQHAGGAQIVAHFSSIHEVHVGAFHPDAAWNHELSMFSERLNRLKSIINEYAEVKILKA